jgi:hypothetical protein
MAFAATPDLKRLLFATYRDSYKYHNLFANPRTAMLIDNRSNQSSDHYQALAVTALGSSSEVPENQRDELLQIFLKKHPSLEEFVTSSCYALLELKVERYYLVSRFQEVTSLSP